MKTLLSRIIFLRDEIKDNLGLYLVILGFMLFQLAADFCGSYAALVGKLKKFLLKIVAIELEILVRVIFLVIQTLLVLFSESGVSYF